MIFFFFVCKCSANKFMKVMLKRNSREKDGKVCGGRSFPRRSRTTSLPPSYHPRSRRKIKGPLQTLRKPPPTWSLLFQYHYYRDRNLSIYTARHSFFHFQSSGFTVFFFFFNFYSPSVCFSIPWISIKSFASFPRQAPGLKSFFIM